MQTHLRLNYFWLLTFCAMMNCNYHMQSLPTDLRLAQWSVAPVEGTLADGLEVATVTLRLTDANHVPQADQGICLNVDNLNAVLTLPGSQPNTAAAEANCSAWGTTNLNGQLQANVAFLAPQPAPTTLQVQVYGYLMAQSQPAMGAALYAPARIAFSAPKQKAGLNIDSAGAAAVQAGAVTRFAVSMRNGDNAIVPDYRGTVSFTCSDANASLPAAYTFTSADAGAATFQFTFKQGGRQSLSIHDSQRPQYDTTGSWTVQAAALQRFDLAIQPKVFIAGMTSTLSVTAEDSFGNLISNYAGPVALSIDGGTISPLTNSFSAGVLVHTLAPLTTHAEVLLTQAGPHTLHVTDPASGAAGELDGVAVTPSVATQAQVSLNPCATTTYTPLSAQLTLFDAYMNIATGYTGTVALSSTDPQAIFSTTPGGTDSLAQYTFNAADSGTHTFGAILKTIPTATPTQMQNLTFADLEVAHIQATKTLSLSASSNYFVLALAPLANATLAGSTNDLSVYEYSTTGAFVSNANVVAHTRSPNDPAATTSAAVAGLTTPFFLTPAITFYTAGMRSVVVTDVMRPNVGGALTLPVLSGPVTHYKLSGVQDAVAGTWQSVEVTAEDAWNNTVADSNQTLRFSCSDTAATLPAFYTLKAADEGHHTFVNGVRLVTAGISSVTVTDANQNTGHVTDIKVIPSTSNSNSTNPSPSTGTAITVSP